MRPERQEPPAANRGPSGVYNGNGNIFPRSADHLADLDALAEALRGRFVVQTQIDGEKYRTAVYMSAKAAENAARRATARGKHCRVTLCQLMPVGVVQGLGVAL